MQDIFSPSFFFQSDFKVDQLSHEHSVHFMLHWLWQLVGGGGTAGPKERLCIHRPAALSALCLSWLGMIWKLGEGGPLCTKQASQSSIFCIATDAVQNILHWLACFVRNEPPSLKYQYFLSISSLGLFSLCTDRYSMGSTYPLYIPPHARNVQPIVNSQDSLYIDRQPCPPSAWAGWGGFET